LDDTVSTSRVVGDRLSEYTTDYVRRLLVERRYIYARLTNQGGSIILRDSDVVDHDRPTGYSTEIGNSFHLDLIQLEMELQGMVDRGEYSKKEIDALITWADGMSAQEAAYYLHARGAVSVRKMRSRAAKKLQRQMDGQAESGTASK
jgi:hypothetical protein